MSFGKGEAWLQYTGSCKIAFPSFMLLKNIVYKIAMISLHRSSFIKTSS
jgi:hypothetical protein